MMPFVIAGTGYTGGRVLASIDDAIGISRSLADEPGSARFFTRDLDDPPTEPIRLHGRCSLLYTIPPIQDPAGDTRLAGLINAIERSQTGDARLAGLINAIERSQTGDARLAGLINAIEPTPRRIVYLSTSGVYGDRQAAMTDESIAPAPQSARAKRRLASEQQLLRACGKSDCDAVILRVPGIYGPGRLRLEQLQSGIPVLRESDANPGSRIHVDDLVRCCVAALQAATPPGIYNIGDGDFRSSSWFAAKVADLAGFAPPPSISRDEAERTLSPLRLSFLRESRKLDTTKMREVLGVVPHYQDAEDGIRESLIADSLLDH